VHVYHLRKKLGPKLAKRIVNMHGLGYKFDDSPAAGALVKAAT
jgi:DNA-binding response OmpR family regulator